MQKSHVLIGKHLNDGKVHQLKRGVSIARFTVVVDKTGTIAAIDPVSDTGGDGKRIAELVKKLEK